MNAVLVIALVSVVVVVVGLVLYKTRVVESFVGARWPSTPHPGNFVQWLNSQPRTIINGASVKSGLIYLKGGRSNEMCSNRGNHIMCGGDKPGWISNPPPALRVVWTSDLASNRVKVAILGDNNGSLNPGKYCTAIQNSSDDARIGCILSGASTGGAMRQDFVIEDLGNRQIAIRTWKSGADKYCADDADGIRCNRGSLGAWERFTWSPA